MAQRNIIRYKKGIVNESYIDFLLKNQIKCIDLRVLVDYSFCILKLILNKLCDNEYVNSCQDVDNSLLPRSYEETFVQRK